MNTIADFNAQLASAKLAALRTLTQLMTAPLDAAARELRLIATAILRTAAIPIPASPPKPAPPPTKPRQPTPPSTTSLITRALAAAAHLAPPVPTASTDLHPAKSHHAPHHAPHPSVSPRLRGEPPPLLRKVNGPQPRSP